MLHAYIHTYIYTYIHITYIHTHILLYYTCIHTYIHTLYATCIHTLYATCIHTYIHTYIHIYIHTYYIHTYIILYMHTHIYTYLHSYSIVIFYILINAPPPLEVPCLYIYNSLDRAYHVDQQGHAGNKGEQRAKWNHNCTAKTVIIMNKLQERKEPISFSIIIIIMSAPKQSSCVHKLYTLHVTNKKKTPLLYSV